MVQISSYTERLTARRATLVSTQRRYNTVATVRVATFLLGAAAGWWGLKEGAAWGYLVAGAALAAFIVLIFIHQVLERRRRSAERAVTFYERGLSRLRHTWMGEGTTGDRFLTAEHPYAADLDIFGNGSLFERLCVAQTKQGQQRLADWLLSPATEEEARSRQGAVRELAPMLDWRETLHEDGAESSATLDAATMHAWVSGESLQLSAFVVWWVRGLSAASFGALLYWLLLSGSPVPFFLLVPMVALTERLLARKTSKVLHALGQPIAELRALRGIARQIERTKFSSEWLQWHTKRLVATGTLASVAIDRLVRLVDWYESRRNQLFALFAYALLWGPNFAIWLDKWRREHGQAAVDWLEVAGDIEALSSLAGYAYESPNHVYPDILSGPAKLHGELVGHPLLAADKCVHNDVALSSAGEGPAIYLVSGSNMSGKSTYLRALGVNVVLALAGAPVRAKVFRVSVLHVAASLRVQDSLQGGASRFFAEIRRLKMVVDSSRVRPTLFLLDEILSGTNSKDRLLGTEGVMRSLVAGDSIGLITTHDLALADAADKMKTRGRNVHFSDDLSQQGELVFDYKLREGVVKKSNAVALMKSIGLDV